MKTHKKILLIFFLFITLLAVYAVWYFQLFELSYLKSSLINMIVINKDHPYLMAFVYFLIYLIIAALAVPGAAVFTIAGGALFGFLEASILVLIAAALGCTLAFLVSRYILYEAYLHKYKDRLKEINQHMDKHGANYLFFLRLNPIVPFFLINTVMGLTSMRTWTFFWISLIGMLPGTLLYVNAGTQLSEITSLNDLLSWQVLTALFLLGIFPMIINLIATEKKN